MVIYAIADNNWILYYCPGILTAIEEHHHRPVETVDQI